MPSMSSNGRSSGPAPLADFAITRDVWRLVVLAVPIGVLSALVALALLHGIGLLTNLLYFGRLGSDLVAPGGTHLGVWSILVPVLGGAVVGLMARFGSEGIRGHGIPEAMENILMNGSRVQPRLAILKPISSVISIGSGGPFGAEGPIILTGGALGSLLAQTIHLSSAERKTLLVAGAAGGMSGVFGTPVAATMLAVELLLFEWRPRSMVPAAAAAATAAAVRIEFADHGLIAPAPLFPVPVHTPVGDIGLLSALAIGIAGGIVAWILTGAVYRAEDAFGHLRLHWAWWPAIGGVVVGVGGLIEPRALGVGYETLADQLAGRIAVMSLLAFVAVKLVIWAVALGSGTSGGILAPLLLIGAGVGGVLSPLLPGGSVALWCLVGMAAALAGVMRSPFTAVIFAVELTHDTNALLPLLIAATAAHLMSVLLLRRSILTEKVARRGVHVTREYYADPLEAMRVHDVMRTHLVTFDPRETVADVRAALTEDPLARQRLYPLVDDAGRMSAVVSLSDIVRADDPDAPVGGLARRDPVTARRGETLRQASDRMAEMGVGVLPVVADDDPTALQGLISPLDVFRAHVRARREEIHRERVLGHGAEEPRLRRADVPARKRWRR